MAGDGMIWGAIICIPFWLIFIWLIKVGAIALQTLVFVGLGLTLSGLLLFLILSLPLKAKKEKKYWDTFIENIPTPPTRSKLRSKDSSESGTPT